MRLTMIFLVFILGSFLMIAGCGGSDDNDNDNNNTLPTNPDAVTSENADWLVSLMAIPGAKDELTQYVIVRYLLTANVPTTDDDVVLMINNVDVALEGYSVIPGTYMGYVDLNEGTEYAVKFIYNGTTKIDTQLKIAYMPSVTFPATFTANQAAAISWTQGGNNQYQFIEALSISPDYTDESDEVKQLDVSARSYTFPANSVESYGSGTLYYLILDQMNFKIENRIALMSYANDSQEYFPTKDINNRIDLVTQALKLYRSVNR